MELREGQVAVVTGAASGIGFALAEALGARGLAIVLADVERPALDGAVAALRERGFTAEGFVCDVADAQSVEGLAQAALSRFGQVDLLINNAGVGGALAPMWHTQPGDWAWTFGVNVFGVANGVRAFLPAMVQRGQGHVVNIASAAGLTAPPFLGPYVASKHAVVGLSESLASELAIIGSAIRVSVVCPGHVRSRIAQSERNRPKAYEAPSKTPADMLTRIQAGFAQALGEPMAPAAFAARVLAGIERNSFLVLTHPALNDQVRARLAALGNAEAAAA